MSVAEAHTQTQPRRWSPQAVFFTVLLHGIVLYYIAVTFQILPPLVSKNDEQPPIQVTNWQPPPPKVDPDPVVQKHVFHPHIPTPAPTPPVVQPSPLAPAAPSADPGPATVFVGNEVGEQPLSRGLPNYPVAAIRDDKEGVVTLSITIMPDGSVRDVQVVSARPHGYFEDSAVRSVQTWRYAPSNTIRKNVIVRMDFVLRG